MGTTALATMDVRQDRHASGNRTIVDLHLGEAIQEVPGLVFSKWPKVEIGCIHVRNPVRDR